MLLTENGAALLMVAWLVSDGQPRLRGSRKASFS